MAETKPTPFQHYLECANEHLDIKSMPKALSHLNHGDVGT